MHIYSFLFKPFIGYIISSLFTYIFNDHTLVIQYLFYSPFSTTSQCLQFLSCTILSFTNISHSTQLALQNMFSVSFYTLSLKHETVFPALSMISSPFPMFQSSHKWFSLSVFRSPLRSLFSFYYLFVTFLRPLPLLCFCFVMWRFALTVLRFFIITLTHSLRSSSKRTKNTDEETGLGGGKERGEWMRKRRANTKQNN